MVSEITFESPTIPAKDQLNSSALPCLIQSPKHEAKMPTPFVQDLGKEQEESHSAPSSKAKAEVLSSWIQALQLPPGVQSQLEMMMEAVDSNSTPSVKNSSPSAYEAPASSAPPAPPSPSPSLRSRIRKACGNMDLVGKLKKGKEVAQQRLDEINRIYHRVHSWRKMAHRRLCSYRGWNETILEDVGEIEEILTAQRSRLVRSGSRDQCESKSDLVKRYGTGNLQLNNDR